MVTCLHNFRCWDQGSQDQDSSVLNACIQWAYCSQQYWLHLSKSQSQYIVSVMRALGFSFKFGNIMSNLSWQFPLWNLPTSAKKVWVTLVKASMLFLQSRQHWNEAHQPMGADWLLKCGWCSCLFISILCDLWCQRFPMWTVCHDVLWMVQCETFEWCDVIFWLEVGNAVTVCCPSDLLPSLVQGSSPEPVCVPHSLLLSQVTKQGIQIPWLWLDLYTHLQLYLLCMCGSLCDAFICFILWCELQSL